MLGKVKKTGPAAPAVFEVMAAAVQAAINNAAVAQDEAVVQDAVVAQDAAVAQVEVVVPVTVPALAIAEKRSSPTKAKK